MDVALKDFLKFVSKPENDWDLFRLSLEVSRIQDTNVDIEACNRQVDLIASNIRANCSRDSDVYTTIAAVNKELFEKERFSGNEEDYYDPRNSYMSSVLERRTGIPITLCILYKEIAEKVGLPLKYVGMPGHFLLKYQLPIREIFIDVFSQGKIMLAEECFSLIEQISDSIEPSHRHLNSTRAPDVLLRLLLNLKSIYRNRGDSALLLQILERRIPVLVDPLPEILERGLLKITLENYKGALADLEYYLANTRNEEMKTVLKKQIQRLCDLAAGN